MNQQHICIYVNLIPIYSSRRKTKISLFEGYFFPEGFHEGLDFIASLNTPIVE
jgi:hypothetical protein